MELQGTLVLCRNSSIIITNVSGTGALAKTWRPPVSPVSVSIPVQPAGRLSSSGRSVVVTRKVVTKLSTAAGAEEENDFAGNGRRRRKRTRARTTLVLEQRKEFSKCVNCSSARSESPSTSARASTRNPLQRSVSTGRKFHGEDRIVVKATKEEEEEGEETVAEVKSAIGSSQNLDQAYDSEASEKGGGGGSSFLAFLCPLLKLIGGGDPAAPRNAAFESATSGIASLARLPWGSQVDAGLVAERNAKGQPAKLFQLYEFEACPFCRRVREALTELDLSAEVYPCPKGSLRHREFVRKNGGREQFPYFLDPNTGVKLYESSEIVNYLFKEYGGGRNPTRGLLESTLVTGWVPTLVRAGRGMMLYSKATSKPPPSMLELFSYENNQFARLVREALCELELPYILRNSGKGSASRDSLLQLAGSTQVPYLVDPNTGTSMAESLNIVDYLFKTYGGVSKK